jgi:hypothetical protein
MNLLVRLKAIHICLIVIAILSVFFASEIHNYLNSENGDLVDFIFLAIYQGLAFCTLYIPLWIIGLRKITTIDYGGAVKVTLVAHLPFFFSFLYIFDLTLFGYSLNLYLTQIAYSATFLIFLTYIFNYSERGLLTFNVFLSRSGVDVDEISIFDALLLWIGITSVLSVYYLSVGSYSSLKTLIISSALFLLLFFGLNLKLRLPSFKSHLGLIIILLIALLFRIEPYLYVMGGQDQGIYVNMSAVYERTGGPFYTDTLREALSAEDKKVYDERNQLMQTGNPHSRNFGGVHQLGFFFEDISKSKYVSQFLVLHPIWMAIFAKTFGTDFRVYSHLFFSTLLIVAVYFIVLDLSNGKKLAAFSVALFLALNPLVAFFSKLPTKEIILYFFFLAGAYSLIQYYQKSRTGLLKPIYLFISFLLVFSLFFVHTQPVLYIPFFYGVLVISTIFEQHRTIRKQLLWYCTAVFFGYGISLIYSYQFAYPIFMNTFSTYGKFLYGPSWRLGFLVTTLCLVAFQFVVFLFRKKLRHLLLKYEKAVLWLPLICLVALISVSVPDLMENTGLSLAKRSSLYSFILYISPFALPFFVLAILALKSLIKDKIFYIFFVLLMGLEWFFIIERTPTLYHYYAARYLIGAIILSTVAIALFLSKLFEKSAFIKAISGLSILLISFYYIHYTSFQFKGGYAEGAADSLKRIVDRVDQSDILFVGPVFNSWVKPAFKFYYGINTYRVWSFEDARKVILDSYEIRTNFNDIYILLPALVDYEGVVLVDIIEYKEGILEHSKTYIPRSFFYLKYDVFVYKIDRSRFFDLDVTRRIDPRMNPQGKFVNFYKEFWTNGQGIIKDISYPLTRKDKFLIVKTRGHTPFDDEIHKLSLKVNVNKRVNLPYSHKKGRAYYFDLRGVDIMEIKEIEILSTPWIPPGEKRGKFGIWLDYIQATDK